MLYIFFSVAGRTHKKAVLFSSRRKSVKHKALLCLLLLLFAFPVSPVHAGRKADFSFTDLEGKTYTPQSVKGRPVVIYVGSHL